MVTNTIKGFLQTFPMEPQTVLQQIALSFDVSWWQSLLGLATGGTVVVAGKDIRRDPFALTALIASHKITLTLAVPSEATSWLEVVTFCNCANPHGNGIFPLGRRLAIT